MSRAALAKKKPKTANNLDGQTRMAAGEFKAKCLAIMDQVNKTGIPLVVTKRGEPVIKVVPIRGGKKRLKNSFFGGLKGIVEIVGDPDDLIRPATPLEDYDMLK